MYARGDVRVEDRDDPTILDPADAILRLSATCVCGSDLWPYRGVEEVHEIPMADGTLVATPGLPGPGLIPSFLAASDVLAKIKELTGGFGAHSVIEAVGTQESMMQAIRSARPGGNVGYVGVSHDVSLPGDELFFSGVHGQGWARALPPLLWNLHRACRSIRLIWADSACNGKLTAWAAE